MKLVMAFYFLMFVVALRVFKFIAFDWWWWILKSLFNAIFRRNR